MTYRWRKGRKEIEGEERDLRPRIDHLYHQVNMVSHTMTVRFGEDSCSDFVSSSLSLRLATNTTQAIKHQNTGHMVTITQSHAKGLQPCRTRAMVENDLLPRWHFLGTQLLALHPDRKTRFGNVPYVFRCPQDNRVGTILSFTISISLSQYIDLSLLQYIDI